MWQLWDRKVMFKAYILAFAKSALQQNSDKSGVTNTGSLNHVQFWFIPQLKLVTLSLELGLTGAKSWRLTWSHILGDSLEFTRCSARVKQNWHMNLSKTQYGSLQEADILKGGLIASQALLETLGLLPTCSLMDIWLDIKSPILVDMFAIAHWTPWLYHCTHNHLWQG